MGWCLDCHRNPEKFVRPREKVFNIHYKAPANQEEMGLKLMKEYKIQSLTELHDVPQIKTRQGSMDGSGKFKC